MSFRKWAKRRNLDAQEKQQVRKMSNLYAVGSSVRITGSKVVKNKVSRQCIKARVLTWSMASGRSRSGVMSSPFSTFSLAMDRGIEAHRKRPSVSPRGASNMKPKMQVQIAASKS